MNLTVGLASVLLVLSSTGCGVLSQDAGPVQTANEEIDAGKAEAVRMEIRMGGGELRVDGGGTKLMAGSFRYSERVGRPIVRYDLANSRGQLTVDSPKQSSSLGKTVNEWNLRMGNEVPLDVTVNVGGGTADLDMSRLPLRELSVNVGAGELRLNLAGKYTTDVTVHVNGGAGETQIRLPRDVGAVVDATVGIGGINTNGLSKRDGRYYNDAYAEGKPALRLDVRGGVGDITLNVEK